MALIEAYNLQEHTYTPQENSHIPLSIPNIPEIRILSHLRLVYGFLGKVFGAFFPMILGCWSPTQRTIHPENGRYGLPLRLCLRHPRDSLDHPRLFQQRWVKLSRNCRFTALATFYTYPDMPSLDEHMPTLTSTDNLPVIARKSSIWWSSRGRTPDMVASIRQKVRA